MGEAMGYGETYGALLDGIAEQADSIAMRYFRAEELRTERKGDGTAVTQADRAVEEMARAKVAAGGLGVGGLGEEVGGGGWHGGRQAGRGEEIIYAIGGNGGVLSRVSAVWTP